MIRSIPRYLLRRYLLRYPPPMRVTRYRALLRRQWFKQVLEEIKPEVLPPEVEEAVAVREERGNPNAIAPAGIQPPPPYYHQYHCRNADPLNCMVPLQAVDADPTCTACPVCDFPAVLKPGSVIVGRRGSYRVGRCLGRRGRGRLYAGIQAGAEKNITIKEYVLPSRYFNPEEQRHRQQGFASLAGLSLADGRNQDLRVVTPLDAIADDLQGRCYLITPHADASPTLNQYLCQGGLSSAVVQHALNQALQSLAFLHQQKFALPMGQVQMGMAHGNLSLDSLLWVMQGNNSFIYLTDVDLWESLFDPARVEQSTASPREDLQNLGRIAFYLLTGAIHDSRGQALSPRIDTHWPPVYLPLKQFILRLLEIEVPFESAEAARSALLQIPPAPVISQTAPPETQQKKKTFPLKTVLAVGAGALIVGGLLSILMRPRPVTSADEAPPLCCLADVGAVPTGRFSYTSVAGDTWSRIVEQDRLATASSSDFVSEVLTTEPTLLTQIQTAQPNLQLDYQPAPTLETAIAQVRNGEVDFAILPKFASLPPDLATETIAYDGLAVFVAFNYPKRSQGLPQALNGTISLAQLQQLYSGQVENWDDLSRTSLPVRLYAPADAAATAVFAELVLREADAANADIEGQEEGTTSVPIGNIEQLDTIPMLRSILQDFEQNDVGGIGFAPLSEVFGQCSVYPLALKADDQPPMQALALTFTETPIDPRVDLCDRKGGYVIDADQIRTGAYPLAYPLVVVYLRDNSRPNIGAKFAELLRTTEGQTFLGQLDLVPR